MYRSHQLGIDWCALVNRLLLTDWLRAMPSQWDPVGLYQELWCDGDIRASLAVRPTYEMRQPYTTLFTAPRALLNDNKNTHTQAGRDPCCSNSSYFVNL